MLVSERYNRWYSNRVRTENLRDASQNDLQNTKSLRVSPNSKSYVDQQARTESKRMYAAAIRKQPKTEQDKFEQMGGHDVLRDALKILGVRK